MKIQLDTVIMDINGKPIMVDTETPATCKFFLLKAIDTPQKGDAEMGHEELCELYDILKRIKAACSVLELKSEEATKLKKRMTIFTVSVVGAVCELLDG